jgi:hypothetical protein
MSETLTPIEQLIYEKAASLLPPIIANVVELPIVESIVASVLHKLESASATQAQAVLGALEAQVPKWLEQYITPEISKIQALLKPQVDSASTRVEQVALPHGHVSLPAMRKLASMTTAEIDKAVGV